MEGGGNDEPSKDIELPLDDDEVKVDKAGKFVWW